MVQSRSLQNNFANSDSIKDINCLIELWRPFKRENYDGNRFDNVIAIKFNLKFAIVHFYLLTNITKNYNYMYSAMYLNKNLRSFREFKDNFFNELCLLSSCSNIIKS